MGPACWEDGSRLENSRKGATDIPTVDESARSTDLRPGAWSMHQECASIFAVTCANDQDSTIQIADELAGNVHQIRMLGPSGRLLTNSPPRARSRKRAASHRRSPDGRGEHEGTEPNVAFALRKVKKRTTPRSEWTSGDTTEKFFDYVLKRTI